MKTSRSTIAAAAAALILGACVDSPMPSAPGGEFEFQANTTTAPCGLINDMTKHVRTWFPQPERRTAQETMRALDNACAAGNVALATEHAAVLLQGMETLVNAGRGGDGTTGAALARGLLSCTRSRPAAPEPLYLCSAGADLPSVAHLARSLSDPSGMFAFRLGSEDLAALARDGVPYGNGNAFRWGVELLGGSNWFAAKKGSNVALMYGWPHNGSVSSGKDVVLGGLYELRHWPDTGFADGLVSVGVCALAPLPMGVIPAGNEMRMRRNATLLEHTQPGFCNPDLGPQFQQASVASSVMALASTVLPGTWFAANERSFGTPVVGGSPLDFSTFVAVAADTQGELKANWTIPADIRVGDPISVTVTAYSGGGTPMERVPVRVYIFNNSGTAGGASLIGGTQYGETNEERGEVTLSGSSVGKAGGYTLCVRLDGEFAGFTFTEACSPLFNVKN